VTESVLVPEHLPDDDIVQLSVAYNMIGKHRFGGSWTSAGDMTIAARMGQSRRHAPEILSMARWTMKALFTCIYNGWLPLIYFEGDRRIRYFDNPDGRSIWRVHVRPVDGDERGQVEFEKGDMAYCMVDVGKFLETLKSKFSEQDVPKPGRPRKFPEFDDALDKVLSVIPAGSKNKEIIAEMGSQYSGGWPGKSTQHVRINEARQRALSVR